MRKFVKDTVASIEDAIAFMQGDKSRGVATLVTIPSIDVKSVRKKTGMTQKQFCEVFAIKSGTLQDWEQKRKIPSGAARILLALIDQHPATVKKTLRSLGHTVKDEPSRKAVPKKSVVKKVANKRVVKRNPKRMVLK